MATTDQNITELPIKTASEVSDADYLMGIDLVEGYQVLTKDFADYAVNRAAISIGGKTQTTASALSEVRTTANNAQPKVSGKGLSTNDYTTAEKNKLSGIAAGAEVNQNAFSNVKVGSTTIAADGKTDTFELVAGENITLTPDATNDKVTIKAAETVYTGTSPITVTNKAIGLSNSGVSAGTYKSVTVDAKGRVTAGTNPSTISGYGITDAYTKTAIDEKLDIESEESADANPVTIETTSAQLATRTHLTFAPQQDLHGYDHPWPAGGGKNLLSVNLTSQTKSGVTITVNGDGTIVLSGTASAYTFINLNYVSNNNVAFPAGSYLLNGGLSIAGFSMRVYDSINKIAEGGGASDIPFTIPSNTTGNYIRIDIVSGTTFNNVTIKPMVRLSTVSDSTFEPYSNICPISGLDTAEVKRTGKNLLPISNYASGVHSGVAWTNNKDGSWTANGTPDGSNNNSYAYGIAVYDLGVLPAGTYTASLFDEFGNILTQNGAAFRVGTGESNAFLNWGNSVTFTMDGQTKCFLAPLVRNGYTVNNLVIFPQLELGSTATTYEPYQEQIVETPLPETVYGGTLDLETGELVVDRAAHHVSYFTWQAGNAGWWYTSSATNKAVGLANVFSDKYLTSDSASVSDMPENSVRGNATQRYIYIRNSSYATLADFTTGEANTQLVYELATPITYTLTPKQLALLKGVNHISTNASTVKVTFRAGQLATLEDVAGAVEIADEHIDEKITDMLNILAPIDNGETATRAYSAGEYFCHNNQFCKAKTAIASGATFTLNTNYEVTTIAAELYAALHS